MGGIVSSIFGGSQGSTKSSNQGFNYLKGALSPQVGNATGASNDLAGLLGVGGNPAEGQAGFNNYLHSTGYNFMLDQGSKAVTDNNAAKGLLNSGSTLKALTNYGQNLGSQYYQNYLGDLSGLTQTGNQAAGIIGNAGQTSSSSQSSNKGLLGGIGKIASFASIL